MNEEYTLKISNLHIKIYFYVFNRVQWTTYCFSLNLNNAEPEDKEQWSRGIGII